MNEIKTCFQKYATFQGRADQAEFITFLVFSIIVHSLIGAVGAFLGCLLWVLSLVIIIPGISVTVRRLHDTGHSGWLFWLFLLPIVNLILLIYLCAARSKN